MTQKVKTKPVKPCPFCKGTHLDVEEQGESRKIFWVVCDNCAAEGPWGDTEEEARELWNNRP